MLDKRYVDELYSISCKVSDAFSTFKSYKYSHVIITICRELISN